MLLKRTLLITLLLGSSFSVTAFDSCKFAIEFEGIPAQKNQEIDVAPNVRMEIKTMLATKVKSDVQIASNVTCQHFIGHNYSGSEQEWIGFINSGIKGLVSAGFKDLQFTKIGDEEATYQGELPHMEYRFNGDIAGNKQIIHNLAVLNKEKNEVYTLSVSGNEKVADEILNEYKRLVATFKTK